LSGGSGKPTRPCPAVANSVYHATGERVRDLPITSEKLLQSHRWNSGQGLAGLPLPPDVLD
jgi:hypothetical protein